MDRQQNELQFGFTQGVSPIYAAVVITEILAEAKDNRTPLYITFMDTAKAFDVVQHPVMLDSLYSQSIHGPLWQLYSDMYANIQSVVKWKGELSTTFTEGQGIRQGGTSSADVYKAGKNSLLNQLATLSTYKIGSINTGVVMVADDLALISSSEHSMQQALAVAEIDASRDRYSFNCDKTKTVYINSKLPPSLSLYDKELGWSTSEKHLGIYRNSKNTNIDTVNDRVKSARRAAYSLMGAGLHGLNGVGPEVAIIQYKVYIIPILLYGLEALVLNSKELEILELYHRTNLRYIQHLPVSTAKVALHLISGVLPITAALNIQALTLFRNIIAGDSKAPPAEYTRELILRQLAIKGLDQASWVSHIRRLLHMYELPTAYELNLCTPGKHKWKHVVKNAVLKFHHQELVREAMEKTTLMNMNICSYKPGELHPLWKDLFAPIEIRMATVVAQLLVGRYPLTTSYTNRGGKLALCPLCSTEPETIEHFLLYCQQLLDIRAVYMPHLLGMCHSLSLSVAPEDLVGYILDYTYLHPRQPDFKLWCMKWIYKLHQRRSLLLTRPHNTSVHI
jgi:hypothetical protein